jgi:outer membrane murein-binding lipoprotein Lpp
MKLISATLLGSTLVIAGCASKSEDIKAMYVSPVGYQNYSCDQLQQEAQGVSQRASVASGQQDRARKNDVVKTTVGAVLFWPILLFNEGDGAKANEVANLKGQMNAIQQASVQKQCGFQFQQ